LRLGIVPGGLLERVAHATGLLPEPIMLTMWGMGYSRCAIAAARLGVFAALDGVPRTAEEVAGAISGDVRATEALLIALDGYGILRRRGGRYRLSRSAARWFRPGSPTSFSDGLLFAGELWDAFAATEAAVRSGQGGNFHAPDRPPEFWRNYMRGLATMSRLVGGEFARLVPVDRPPARLLDVAGGHGLLSAAMCRRHSGLRAEVLDLPAAAAEGRQIVAGAAGGDRVRFREGDLREVAWGEGYDVVMLCNILHNLSAGDCRTALAKARAALRPGGTLVVLEGEHAGGEGDVSLAAGFNELLFFIVSGTGLWPEPTLREWIGAAGFEGVRRKRLLMMPVALLLVAKA